MPALTSTKQAIGLAAALLRRPGQIRCALDSSGPAGSGDDWTAAQVLAALRRVVGLDTPEGQALLEWATTPVDVGLDLDAATRAAKARVADELEALGLLERPKVMRIGFRVMRHPDGRREISTVADPDPDDPSIVWASRETAAAVAEESGKVLEILPSKPTLREHCERLLAAGTPVREVDDAIMQALECTRQHARRLRRGWGHRNPPRPRGVS